jgi:hypothetical protein
MKSVLWGAAVLLVLGGTAVRLSNRWREESADHRIAILVDWSEVRDFTARQGMTDEDLLERLRHSGVSAVLVGAATVQDYLWQDMVFSSRALAETVLHQLQDRGVVGITFKPESGKYRLVNQFKNWDRIKDLELGFNPELLGQAREAGLHLVLRVNDDPWLSKEKLFGDLQEIGSANQELGFLLNTDEIPGGPDASSAWVTFLESQNYAQLFFEFHPAKSTLKLAYRTPRSTYRAHTIAAIELKDLTADQQQSRWLRAVQERSCRFLLFHVSPSDSVSSFLENLSGVRQTLRRHGWDIAWPKPRLTWSFPTFAQRQLGPVAALLLAIGVPVWALRLSLSKTPWVSYFQILLVTLVGACIMSAVAENPLTRLEIIPFRGIKLAFAMAWGGSFLTLYPWKEIESQLYQVVRRVDVLVGLVLAIVVGYALIRMGNAGSGWQTGWEQHVRDRLEDFLVARPRFKEFALGYPLLLLGLHMRPFQKSKSFWRDRRFWIGVGMIGPISMVNTFCHLHSPLYLAFWRSLNGFVIGTLFGLFLIAVKKWGAPRLAA